MLPGLAFYVGAGILFLCGLRSLYLHNKYFPVWATFSPQNTPFKHVWTSRVVNKCNCFLHCYSNVLVLSSSAGIPCRHDRQDLVGGFLKPACQDHRRFKQQRSGCECPLVDTGKSTVILLGPSPNRLRPLRFEMEFPDGIPWVIETNFHGLLIRRESIKSEEFTES